MRKTIHQLFEEFMYECEFARRLKPGTRRSYVQAFKTFYTLLPDITLDQLTTSTIVAFFKILEERRRIVGRGIIKTGVKKSTIAAYWCKLNVFFQWLISKNYILENPFKAMKYIAPSYEDKKYLEKEDVEKILAAIHLHHDGKLLLFKRNLVLFHLLLFCGLRKHELLSLLVRDIDFERKIITIHGETSKSARMRQIPLHSTAIMYLKDYLKERINYNTPYLIVSANKDDKLTDAGLKHLVTKIRDSSGIAFHLHQFRHTFAVNFLKSSNNIFKLKHLLGHKDIRVTTIYLRCLPPEEMQRDVECMSIDNFI